MFTRVTHYKLKPGTIDRAKEILEELKPQIMGMNGMKQFINAVDDDGNGVVVALVESREISDANMPKVQELWGKFGEVLAAPPEPQGFDVFMNESNG